MTLSFLTESFEVRSSLIRTSSLDGTNTLYPAWIRRWPSFRDNEQQMKERFKIFWTRCIGKWSVYFQDLLEVSEEVFFCGEVVGGKGHLLVDGAPTLSFCVACVPLTWASCVPFTGAAGNETNIWVRYSRRSAALDPRPFCRQMHSPSQISGQKAQCIQTASNPYGVVTPGTAGASLKHILHVQHSLCQKTAESTGQGAQGSHGNMSRRWLTAISLLPSFKKKIVNNKINK